METDRTNNNHVGTPGILRSRGDTGNGRSQRGGGGSRGRNGMMYSNDSFGDNGQGLGLLESGNKSVQWPSSRGGVDSDIAATAIILPDMSLQMTSSMTWDSSMVRFHIIGNARI